MVENMWILVVTPWTSCVYSEFINEKAFTIFNKFYKIVSYDFRIDYTQARFISEKFFETHLLFDATKEKCSMEPVKVLNSRRLVTFYPDYRGKRTSSHGRS